MTDGTDGKPLPRKPDVTAATPENDKPDAGSASRTAPFKEADLSDPNCNIALLDAKKIQNTPGSNAAENSILSGATINKPAAAPANDTTRPANAAENDGKTGNPDSGNASKNTDTTPGDSDHERGLWWSHEHRNWQDRDRDDWGVRHLHIHRLGFRQDSGPPPFATSMLGLNSDNSPDSRPSSLATRMLGLNSDNSPDSRPSSLTTRMLGLNPDKSPEPNQAKFRNLNDRSHDPSRISFHISSLFGSHSNSAGSDSLAAASPNSSDVSTNSAPDHSRMEALATPEGRKAALAQLLATGQIQRGFATPRPALAHSVEPSAITALSASEAADMSPEKSVPPEAATLSAMTLSATSTDKPANGSLHNDLDSVMQSQMVAGHDYAFVDRLDKTQQDKWLTDNPDKKEDYDRYERLHTSGYYGQIDQMSAAQQEIWKDYASQAQLKAYQDYHNALNKGDYSVFDKIGNTHAGMEAKDTPKAQLEKDYKLVYDSLTPEQRAGLNQYNDTRNAIESAGQTHDYNELSRLSGASPANRTIDLWLQNASKAEREAFGNAVIAQQLKAESSSNKNWFDNATPEQKKAFFDTLNKKNDAEQDAWWSRVADPAATKENPWSSAQKYYLQDQLARKNGITDGALEATKNGMPPLPEKLSDTDRLSAGDYSHMQKDYANASAADKAKYVEQYTRHLSDAEKESFAKLPAKDQQTAAYLDHIKAPGKDASERLQNYHNYTVNESSGYFSYLDKMSGTQLKAWLQEATPEQRHAYENYMDEKSAGDYSFINAENYQSFKQYSSDTDWNNYKVFRDRIDSGDFSFLERLQGDNKNNIESYARYSDADYAKYQDYKLHETAGDYSFVTRRPAAEQKDWYDHATPEQKQKYENFKDKIQGGDFSIVENYLSSLKQQQPPNGALSAAEIEQARQSWIKENAKTTVDDKPFDMEAKYNTYSRDLNTLKTQIDDYRKMDGMQPSERQEWLQKHAEEQTGYKQWQIQSATGDCSWIDRMPAADKADLLENYKEPNSPLKSEADSYRAYQERIAAGDYSHIYILDKDNYDKWKANASPQELERYKNYVDKVSAGDFSYVDRYSKETRDDWQARLDKLNPATKANDGLDDFRTNATVWLNDIAGGRKAYQARVDAGDYSMIDKLNNKNWADFNANSTSAQWKAYKACKAAINNNDYSFVDRLRKTGADAGSETKPLDAWLNTATPEEKQKYIDYHNSQPQAGQILVDSDKPDSINKSIQEANGASPAGKINDSAPAKPPEQTTPETTTNSGPPPFKPDNKQPEHSDAPAAQPDPARQSLPDIPAQQAAQSNPEKQRSDQEIYNNFVSKLNNVKSDSERDALLNAVKPEEKKAIADYLADGKNNSSSQQVFTQIISKIGDNRDMTSADFVKDLQEQNQNIQKLQIAALSDISSTGGLQSSTVPNDTSNKQPAPSGGWTEGKTGASTGSPGTNIGGPDTNAGKIDINTGVPGAQTGKPDPNIGSASPGKLDNSAGAFPDNPISVLSHDHGPEIPVIQPPKPKDPTTKTGDPNRKFPDSPVDPGASTPGSTAPVPTTPGSTQTQSPFPLPIGVPFPFPVPSTSAKQLKDSASTERPDVGKPITSYLNQDHRLPFTDTSASTNIGSGVLEPIPLPVNHIPSSVNPGPSSGSIYNIPGTHYPPSNDYSPIAQLSDRLVSKEKVLQDFSRSINSDQLKYTSDEYYGKILTDYSKISSQYVDKSGQYTSSLGNTGGKIDLSGSANPMPGDSKISSDSTRLRSQSDAYSTDRQTLPAGSDTKVGTLSGSSADGHQTTTASQLSTAGNIGAVSASASEKHDGTTTLKSDAGGQLSRSTLPGEPGSLSARSLLEAAGKNLADAAGRPLVDAAGKAIADTAGRHLADAAGRTLADATGKTLPDLAGKALADATGKTLADAGRLLADPTGRPLSEAAGRPLVDAAGRPLIDATGRPVGLDGRPVNIDATTGRPTPPGDITGGAKPGDHLSNRLPDPGTLVKIPDLPGRGPAEGAAGRPGFETSGAKPGASQDITGGKIIPGAEAITQTRAVADPGARGAEAGAARDGKTGIPEKGGPLAPGETPSSKGGPLIPAGPGTVSGIIVMPGKGESGKGERGAEPGESPTGRTGARDPGIGLSQMGQGPTTTPGQKPNTEPQGPPASASGTQLQPVNLPTVHITGQDPKASGSAADPKSGPSAQDPKASGSAADPKSGPSAQDPKASGSAADPKSGPSAQDPKASGSAADPKSGPSAQDPITSGSAADPKSGPPAQDPIASGSAVDPKSGPPTHDGPVHDTHAPVPTPDGPIHAPQPHEPVPTPDGPIHEPVRTPEPGSVSGHEPETGSSTWISDAKGTEHGAEPTRTQAESPESSTGHQSTPTLPAEQDGGERDSHQVDAGRTSGLDETTLPEGKPGTHQADHATMSSDENAPFISSHSAETIFAHQLENDLRILEKIEQHTNQQEQSWQDAQTRIDIIEQTGANTGLHEDTTPSLQEIVASFVEPGPTPDSETAGHHDHKTETPFTDLDTTLMNVLSGVVGGHTHHGDFTPLSGAGDEISAADALAQLGEKLDEDLGLIGNSSADADFAGGSSGALGIVADALGLVNSDIDPVERLENDILQGLISSAGIDAGKDDLEEILAMKHQKELEDKDRKDQDEHTREEEAKRYAAAMLAALKARQAQDEANRVRAQSESLNVEPRQKYIVMKGDTLELIAQKRLLNKRFAALIYELNKSRIPVKLKDGKRLLQLKPRLVLLLPTQVEIKKFQTRIFGHTHERFEYDTEFDEKARPRRAALPAPDSAVKEQEPMPPATTELVPPRPPTPENPAESKRPVDQGKARRRDNIESWLGKLQETANSGRSKYICRLGDSLRSIAMRHPLLKDVTLWKLLAELNNISTHTTSKGQPLAELKRGQVLVLPTPEDIAEFREKQRPSLASTIRQVDTADKQCPKCSLQCGINAPICPACSQIFETNRQATRATDTTVAEQDLPAVDTSDDIQFISHSRIFVGARDYLAQTGAKAQLPSAQTKEDSGENQKQDQSSAEQVGAETKRATSNSDSRTGPFATQRNQIRYLSDDCRAVTFGNMDKSGDGFRTRLEFKMNEFWLPVILYEINQDGSSIHEYKMNGARKTKRIELPAAKARQLAINDLNKNWEQYITKFFRNYSS